MTYAPSQIALTRKEALQANQPEQRWLRLRDAALVTGAALTPMAQRLAAVVSTAKAADVRRAAVSSRWRRLEKQVMLSAEPGIAGAPAEGAVDGASQSAGHAGSGLLARVIAAAKEARAEQEAASRANELREQAILEETAALEGALEAADAPPTPREGGLPSLPNPVWSEFHFVGPAGERVLLPRKGSSMDALARSRRGSLDHAIPNLANNLDAYDAQCDAAAVASGPPSPGGGGVDKNSPRASAQPRPAHSSACAIL